MSVKWLYFSVICLNYARDLLTGPCYGVNVINVQYVSLNLRNKI